MHNVKTMWSVKNLLMSVLCTEIDSFPSNSLHSLFLLLNSSSNLHSASYKTINHIHALVPFTCSLQCEILNACCSVLSGSQRFSPANQRRRSSGSLAARPMRTLADARTRANKARGRSRASVCACFVAWCCQIVRINAFFFFNHIKMVISFIPNPYCTYIVLITEFRFLSQWFVTHSLVFLHFFSLLNKLVSTQALNWLSLCAL